MTSWTDALRYVTSSESLGASTSAKPPGASTSAEPPGASTIAEPPAESISAEPLGQMACRIMWADIVLYDGPRDLQTDCYFTRHWDQASQASGIGSRLSSSSEVDVAGFPGACSLSMNAMRLVLAPVLGNVAELEFAEVGPAITFLNFLGASQEFWRGKEESSRAALPMRLVLGALAAGSLTPRLAQAAAIEWNRFTQGQAVRDLAIPLAGAQALLQHEVAQETSLVCFVEPVAVHRKGYIFSRSPSFTSDVFSWSRWFPKNFPWRSEHAGIALALKGGAAAHMLHQHGFGDLDFYLYKERGRVDLAGAASPSDEQRDESAAVMLIDRAARAVCSQAKRTLLVRNSGTLTIIMEVDDQRTQRVQFFMHLFDSISQIMITSDLDATQIVYCGASTSAEPPGLYLSPLALTAYASGFITIRSDLDQSRQQRTLRRLACYVRRGFGICAPRGRLGASSLKLLRSLTRSKQLRHLQWQGTCEMDEPLTRNGFDSGPEGDLPVRSIATRWEARKSLKAVIDYRKGASPLETCDREIQYAEYADGKIVFSWYPRPPEMHGQLLRVPEMWFDAIEFNFNNTGSRPRGPPWNHTIHRGGLRACLCSWVDLVPYLTFYPHQMFKFFLLADKCSMPAPGVNELS